MSADQLLGTTGGTSFLGASGDGGTGGVSNISGLPAADASSGVPTSYGGGPTADVGGTFSSADPVPQSGVSSFVSKNWPTLASAGILGFEGLTKNQTLPAEQQLRSAATTTAGQAQALMNPIQTGILPPGAQQAVDASTAANRAGVSSTYGGLGLAGSTMENQAQQGVNRNAAAQTFQIANDLLAKGIDLSKLSASDLTTLLEAELKGDTQFNSALTSFAGGLSGARLAA
jgi:hypothetical protein